MFALRGHPIESIVFVLDKRNPRGITFGYAARDHC